MDKKPQNQISYNHPEKTNSHPVSLADHISPKQQEVKDAMREIKAQMLDLISEIRERTKTISTPMDPPARNKDPRDAILVTPSDHFHLDLLDMMEDVRHDIQLTLEQLRP